MNNTPQEKKAELFRLDLPDRVTKLETQMEGVIKNVDFIKAEVVNFTTSAVTKKDLADLRTVIDQRDTMYVRNMWRVIFGLLAVVGAIALVAAGIEATKISTVIPPAWIKGISGSLLAGGILGIGLSGRQ